MDKSNAVLPMGDLEALFDLVGDNDRWDLVEMWREGSLSVIIFRVCREGFDAEAGGEAGWAA